jgi:hypothetical protein
MDPYPPIQLIVENYTKKLEAVEGPHVFEAIGGRLY